MGKESSRQAVSPWEITAWHGGPGYRRPPSPSAMGRGARSCCWPCHLPQAARTGLGNGAGSSEQALRCCGFQHPAHTPLGKSLGDPGPEIPFWQKGISFSFLAGLVLRFGSTNAAGGSSFVLRQEFKQDDVSHAGSGRAPAPAEASLMKALCVPRRGFPITRNVLSPPPRTEVERSQAWRAAASTMGKSSSCHPGAARRSLARRGLVSVPWR